MPARINGTPIHGESNASRPILGSGGVEVILEGDTDDHAGPFFHLLALTDVEVNEAILDDRITGSLNGMTLIAGSQVPLFTIKQISLTSGSAILYRVSSLDVTPEEIALWNDDEVWDDDEFWGE